MNEWGYDIEKQAPKHLFLPLIMTKFDGRERRELFLKVAKKIKKNNWKRHTRPMINATTRQSIIDGWTQKRKRSTKVIKGIKYSQNPQVGVPVAQCVLLMDNRYPKEDDQASHLCHNRNCIKKEHLVWEDANANQRRLRCQREKVCVCRLEVKCLINCLP
jgi:hypothetical protein